MGPSLIWATRERTGEGRRFSLIFRAMYPHPQISVRANIGRGFGGREADVDDGRLRVNLSHSPLIAGNSAGNRRSRPGAAVQARSLFLPKADSRGSSISTRVGPSETETASARQASCTPYKRGAAPGLIALHRRVSAPPWRARRPRW